MTITPTSDITTTSNYSRNKTWRRWEHSLILAVFSVTFKNLLKYFHLLHGLPDCLSPKCHSAEAPCWVSTLFLWLQMGKWKNWGFAHLHKDQMMPSICLCLTLFMYVWKKSAISQNIGTRVTTHMKKAIYLTGIPNCTSFSIISCDWGLWQMKRKLLD